LPDFEALAADNGGMTHVDQSDPLEIRVLATLTSGTATVADVAMRTGQPESVVGPILEQAVAEQTVTRIKLAKAPSYSLTPKGLHAVGVYQGVQDAVDDAGHVDLGAATRMLMEEYDAARDVATADAVREQADWPADDAMRDRVSSSLNDAFARGALTKEQLDDRTNRALTATTMGELRAVGEGVIEVPPAPPTGIGPVSRGPQVNRIEINPELPKVQWRHVIYAAAYVLLGLFLLLFQPVVGLVALVVGLVLGGFTLRPLFRTGSVHVTNR
jgi:hypothetical protein